MRICLISREYPPDTGWGGVGAYTYQIANGLAEIGHDVHVISLTGDSPKVQFEEPHVRVHVHRVEWNSLLDELNLLLVAAPSAHFVIKTAVALWRKFIELHRQQPFDVVEVPEHLAAGMLQGLTATVPLVVKLHTPHSKFVSENFHGVLPTLDNQLICLFEQVTMLVADLLCSPSEDLAQFVSAELGLARDEVLPALNPVDVKRFSPLGSRAVAGDGKLTVLFVGRLEERKGIPHLIDAVPGVVAKHPNVEFLVVGADTKTAAGGTSMLRDLQRRLAASGCSQYVKFIPHVPLDQVASYYRSADVCVVPSLYENAPYTCIEAMACGKPVVTTTAGGSGEYVKNNEWGLVVPPASAADLTSAINALLSDEPRRVAFGKAARLYVEQNLDRVRIAGQMEGLYLQAAARFQQRRGLYRKPAEKILRDALNLLCAADQMVFDVLYKQSVEFRLKYWLRLLRKRPGLACATAVVSAAETVCAITGLKNRQPELVRKLRRAVAAKQAPPYGSTYLLAELSNLDSAPLDTVERQQSGNSIKRR